MTNAEKRSTAPAGKSPIVWKSHSENCEICSLIDNHSKPGRPKKVKNKGGRSSNKSAVFTTDDILNLSPSKPLPKIVEQCISHVVSIKIKHSTMPNKTIQLPTKGRQVNII